MNKHTHQHYHGGRREASTRKRSRKQRRISHHQEWKGFCFVLSATGRILVIRIGLGIHCNLFLCTLATLAKGTCLQKIALPSETLFKFIRMFFLIAKAIERNNSKMLVYVYILIMPSVMAIQFVGKPACFCT